eukprot:1081671-Pelagomonas_calceolata.AAC.7
MIVPGELFLSTTLLSSFQFFSLNDCGRVVNTTCTTLAWKVSASFLLLTALLTFSIFHVQGAKGSSAPEASEQHSPRGLNGSNDSSRRQSRADGASMSGCEGRRGTYTGSETASAVIKPALGQPQSSRMDANSATRQDGQATATLAVSWTSSIGPFLGAGQEASPGKNKVWLSLAWSVSMLPCCPPSIRGQYYSLCLLLLSLSLLSLLLLFVIYVHYLCCVAAAAAAPAVVVCDNAWVAPSQSLI